MRALTGCAEDCPLAHRQLLNVEQRRYEAALDALKGRDFRLWRPGHGIRRLFVLANLEEGRQAFAVGKFKAAESTLRAGIFPTQEACVRSDGVWNY